MRWLPRLLVAVLLLGGLLQAQDGLQRQFTVPLQDGKLQTRDLLSALLAEYELDGSTLALPDASIDLRGTKGTLLLLASRKLLLDTARFRRDLAGDRLVVTIDRDRTREVRRQLRARVAQFAARLAGEDVTERTFELALPPRLDPGRPLCVLVHGVENDAGIWAELRAFLEAAPRACQVATFTWPDDEGVERIAAALATRLKALGAQPVVIVGYSMGGLVGRAVVEDRALDPGNVRMLVTVGTPHAGSNLAGFRFALEAADLLRDARGPGPFARELLDAAFDHFRDGLGEAGGDLLPGSVCLVRMAARERNPAVEYRAVLGTRSLLDEERLAAVQALVRERLADPKLALVRPRLERWLQDLDELVDGKGDGAVSVARGTLAGVDPVLVPIDHVGLVRRRGLLGRFGRAEDHPVFVQIAAWITGVAPAGAQRTDREP
jgi:pimeloyl-ACP methyl ester carboxylesterase